jgi:CheY-like chemotaxis protein
MGAVRGLVEAHGGMVNLYSGPGDGNTVQIHLPVAAGDDDDGPAFREEDEPIAGDGSEPSPGEDGPPDSTTTPDDVRISPAIPGRGETILLVEDDPALRKAARRALEMAGYRVLTARDGQAGLEILLELGDEVDLVLTDLIMPRMGGRRLYHAARREGRETPFLFASGYGTEREAVSEDSEASIPLLSKPWTVRELTGMVRDILDDVRSD